MPWIIPAVIAGSSIIGGGIASQGAQSAANTQANAQLQAAQTQQNMFNTIVGQEQPFMQGGYGAQSTLNALMGIPSSSYSVPSGTSIPISSSAVPGVGTQQAIPSTAAPQQYITSRGHTGGQTVWRKTLNPAYTTWLNSQNQQKQAASTTPAAVPQSVVNPNGTVGNTGLDAGYLTHQFNPTDMQNYPGYQFALQTGGQAVRNADTPGVGALSGAALKDLMNFNVGTANQYYNQYFNQYQQQQQNIYNRLFGMTQLGQNAASNTGAQGSALGQGIAQAQAGAGASQAAGTIGATNAITGAINNGVGTSLGYMMFNPKTGTTYNMNNPANYDPNLSIATNSSGMPGSTVPQLGGFAGN